jgi:DNA-binding NarL/FixJ family response regulator
MRVVIAEDQVLLREGLARLFADGGHQVVSTLGDGATVAEVVDQEKPDLVVLDIRMPPTYTDEGARAAREIKNRYPEVGVLVLSQHIETTHAVDLVGRPGFGYLLKDRVLEVEEFLQTAGRVAAGGSALDPRQAGGAGRREPTRAAVRPRTPRAGADGRGPDQHRHRTSARPQ